MLYFTSPGILAGSLWGVRRIALGERWDIRYHVYTGCGHLWSHHPDVFVFARKKPRKLAPPPSHLIASSLSPALTG